MPDTFFAENQTVEKPIKTYQSRKKSRQAPVDGSVDDSQIWLEEIEDLQRRLKSFRQRQLRQFECIICRDPAWQPCVTQCGHLVCGPCIRELAIKSYKKGLPWRQTPCPLCRTSLRHPPTLCYELQDSLRSLASEEGIEIPRQKKFNWPPSKPRKKTKRGM
ncbi:hypothetical protein VKT23_014673 [Stygiomarasmius scandens]|uniref:RING-type domain-containing protein n=1 Tax=Marasmiellus scandens TaxID=2682957 RepID=A0ABR1J2G1_9AGAR